MKTSIAILEKIERYAPAFFEEAEKKERETLLAERKEKAKALAGIQAQLEKDVERLQADQDKAQEAVKAAEAALMEKRQEWGRVSGELRSVKHQAGRQAAELERFLVETADPEIDNAIRFFQDRFEYLRGPGRLQVRRVEKKKFISGKQVTTWSTNKKVVELALQYCSEAVEALRDMKLDAALNGKFIEVLKEGLPEVAREQ